MSARVRVGAYNLYLGADLGLIFGEQSPTQLTANLAEVHRQLLATAFPDRARAVARLIVAERLDLVGLQEVCTWHADDALVWNFAEELLGALDALGEPYDAVVSQPTFEGAGPLVVDDREVVLRLAGSNLILRRRGADVRVVSTTTGIFDSALGLAGLGSAEFLIRRGWCAAQCELGDRSFTFVDTHTEAYDEESRSKQRDELLAVLPGSGEPLVLVGDFNATPDQVGMPADLIDAWVAAGNPSNGPDAATCCQVPDLSNPEPELVERIDYVWVRGMGVLGSNRFGADVADRTEGGLWPSDHAGVAAELDLQAVAPPSG